MGKITQLDVRYARAKYRAVAECMFEYPPAEGDVAVSRCLWTFVQHEWETDRNTRNAAKQHVVDNPTHEVEVVVRDAARYYLLPHQIAELTAARSAASGDDQSSSSKESQED